MDMACGLDPARWESVVVIPDEGDFSRQCRAAGLPLKIFPRPRMLSTSFWIGNKRKLPNPLAWIWNLAAISVTASRTQAFLRSEKPDAVMTKGLICHFYGGLAAKRLGIPCIWHVEDFVSERFGGIYRYVFGWFATRVPTRIIAISGPVVRQVPTAARHLASVVTNGIDTRLFRPGRDGAKIREEFGIARDKIVIGNVSRLTPWKGQHHLIEAFALVARENDRAHLMLVGTALFGGISYEKSLHEQVVRLGLADRVTFTGHRFDVPELLAAMDVFAYTAVEKDSWPLSLLQALASGLPVIAFDIEGVREPLGTGVLSTYLIPVGDANNLADSLAVLAGEPNLRMKLGEAARKRAEQACTIEARVKRIESILSELVRASG
jgi:glycosyltransferase involved in cell wall biosynthesis